MERPSGFQLGAAEEVGGLAGHIEGDRQLRRGGVLLDGGVFGQEVGDCGAEALRLRPFSREAVRTSAVFPAATAERWPPLLSFASAARSPS
ncbi:hypothetical protein [Streptomyces sp. NPDC004266]|uniref:hypothetical protein n=1 Tax=Streptomyces sp. NPDC004266 TaxID=3364693 RepID=UPI00369E4119